MPHTRFQVSLDALERSAHVPVEDQVEEHDTDPPAPPVKSDDERERDQLLRVAGPGF